MFQLDLSSLSMLGCSRPRKRRSLLLSSKRTGPVTFIRLPHRGREKMDSRSNQRRPHHEVVSSQVRSSHWLVKIPSGRFRCCRRDGVHRWCAEGRIQVGIHDEPNAPNSTWQGRTFVMWIGDEIAEWRGAGVREDVD